MSRPRITVSPAARAARRWMGIDTWGWDFLRLKRRVKFLSYAQLETSKSIVDLAGAMHKLCDAVDSHKRQLKLFRQVCESLVRAGMQTTDDLECLEKRVEALEAERAVHAR